MYPGGTHGFLYVPQFAVLFSLIDWIQPPVLGEIVWRGLGFGMFAWALWKVGNLFSYSHGRLGITTPYLYVPRSVGCPGIPRFAEQWSDESPTFRSSCFPVFGSSGGKMESGGGFTDHRLDPKADCGGTVAFGLCSIFPDADSFVGGATGYGFGWFCSPQSLVRMGSVGGVLG